MKFKKILCLDFTGNELDDSYWALIEELTESRELATADQLSSNSDADGLLVKLGAKVGKDLIDRLPALKYIGMLGTGYGGIDTEYAASKGITVTNIADYATEGVAEFTFGILLQHLRDLNTALKQAKSGDYSDDFNGHEIRGKKFGVIGLGDIGRRTAKLAQAFGADVVYWSRNRKNDIEQAGIKYAELDDVLKSSDIITLNLALNDETEGIINADRVSMIKLGAIIINPSPMELLDFDALLKRLQKGEITFALDHSDEITEAQLKALQPLEHAIVYPPIAYLTSEATELKKQIYVDNLKSYLLGNPSNKVN